VTADGSFRTDMARLGADIFFKAGARRQLAREIEAQFEAFAATGLPSTTSTPTSTSICIRRSRT